MKVSPFDIRGSSLAIVWSTGSPAGTMIHTARGAERFFTRSSRVVPPTEPAAVSFSVASLLKSNPTTLWPARRRRSAMLKPIFPSPIIPSSILFLSVPQRSLQRVSNLTVRVERQAQLRQRQPQLLRRLETDALHPMRPGGVDVLLLVVDKHRARSRLTGDQNRSPVDIGQRLHLMHITAAHEKVEARS